RRAPPGRRRRTARPRPPLRGRPIVGFWHRYSLPFGRLPVTERRGSPIASARMLEEGPETVGDESVEGDAGEVRTGRRREGRSLTRLLRRGGRRAQERRRTCVLFADASVVGDVRDTLTAGGVDVLSVAVDVQALLDSVASLDPDLVVVDVPGEAS